MKNPGPYGTRLTSIIRLIPPLIDPPILSFSSSGTTDLPPRAARWFSLGGATGLRYGATGMSSIPDANPKCERGRLNDSLAHTSDWGIIFYRSESCRFGAGCLCAAVHGDGGRF